MKVSEMIKNLQEFMQENGDVECWYAVDDEGNNYFRVYYSPTLYYANEYGKMYSKVDLEYKDPEDIEDLVPVCIVN